MAELVGSSEAAVSLPPPSITPVISDDAELARRGVVRVQVFPCSSSETNLLPSLCLEHLTEVAPYNAFAEDNDYAFYKNIMEDCPFPCDVVFSAIAPALLEHFVSDLSEIRLDDVFVVHYNEQHSDSTVARHMDPSDITINVNLERSDDLEGSQLLFYGTKRLKGFIGTDGESSSSSSSSSSCSASPPPSTRVTSLPDDPSPAEEKFLVDTKLGFCTVHYGSHPHEVLSLKKGRRTNVVLTYVFTDKSKSGATRTCF